jgi:hypothetical protein
MASTTASVGERREAQGSGTLPVALKIARWTITSLQNCTISTIVDTRRDYMEPNHHQALDIHDTIE